MFLANTSVEPITQFEIHYLLPKGISNKSHNVYFFHYRTSPLVKAESCCFADPIFFLFLPSRLLALLLGFLSTEKGTLMK
jgi:hypothetical protein